MLVINLLLDIKYFEANGGLFSWIHVFHEANQVVDAISKFGLSLDINARFFLFHSNLFNDP